MYFSLCIKVQNQNKVFFSNRVYIISRLKMLKSILTKAKSWSSGKVKKSAGIGIVFQVGPDNGMYIADISVGGSAEECKLQGKEIA